LIFTIWHYDLPPLSVYDFVLSEFFDPTTSSRSSSIIMPPFPNGASPVLFYLSANKKGPAIAEPLDDSLHQNQLVGTAATRSAHRIEGEQCGVVDPTRQCPSCPIISSPDRLVRARVKVLVDESLHLAAKDVVAQPIRHRRRIEKHKSSHRGGSAFRHLVGSEFGMIQIFAPSPHNWITRPNR